METQPPIGHNGPESWRLRGCEDRVCDCVCMCDVLGHLFWWWPLHIHARTPPFLSQSAGWFLDLPVVRSILFLSLQPCSESSVRLTWLANSSPPFMHSRWRWWRRSVMSYSYLAVRQNKSTTRYLENLDQSTKCFTQWVTKRSFVSE